MVGHSILSIVSGIENRIDLILHAAQENCPSDYSKLVDEFCCSMETELHLSCESSVADIELAFRSCLAKILETQHELKGDIDVCMN